MLKTILSITGKPGLFKIIAHSPKNLIVEDLESKKRFPVSMRDRVVGLGDIAMYTVSEDKPLGEILDSTFSVFNGQPINVKELNENGELRDKFRLILPDFDEDRVRDSDIKKLFNWYNILLESGMTKFTEETKEEKDENKEDKTETKEGKE